MACSSCAAELCVAGGLVRAPPPAFCRPLLWLTTWSRCLLWRCAGLCVAGDRRRVVDDDERDERRRSRCSPPPPPHPSPRTPLWPRRPEPLSPLCLPRPPATPALASPACSALIRLFWWHRRPFPDRRCRRTGACRESGTGRRRRGQRATDARAGGGDRSREQLQVGSGPVHLPPANAGRG